VEVRLAAAVFFFFSNQRSVCVALPFVAAQSSTLLRMRLLLRGCIADAPGQAIIVGEKAVEPSAADPG